MLKIEVFLNKSQLIDTKTLNQNEVRLARSTKSDVFLMDPRVSRNEILIEKQEDGTYLFRQGEKVRHFSEYFETDLFDYKIKFHNLGLLADDDTKSLFIDRLRASSYKQLFSWTLLLFLLFFFEYFVYENWTKDAFRVVNDVLSVVFVIIFFTIAVSLISRAIEGRYNFQKILLLTLKTTTYTILISTNLLGLRWLLTPGVWYEQIYGSLYVILGFYFLWQIGLIIFSHVKSHIRVIIVLSLFFAITLPQVVKYVPIRNTYQYLNWRSAPPLHKAFESKAIPLADFLKKLESL